MSDNLTFLLHSRVEALRAATIAALQGVTNPNEKVLALLELLETLQGNLSSDETLAKLRVIEAMLANL